MLAFNFHDAEAAGPAQKFLESFHLSPLPAGDGAAPNCTIDIYHGGPPPPLPAAAHTFEVPQGLCHADGSTLHLDVDGSRVTLHAPPSSRVAVWLGDTPRARHPIAIINALSYAVQGALRKAALFDFHAAGLIEPRRGGGLLIAGTSGSGKSSLTIRLAASGWRYLTDDMVALSQKGDKGHAGDKGDNRDEGGESVGGGEIRAWAFRKVFAVTEKSLDAVGVQRLRRALGAPVNSDPSKRRLDPAAVFPDLFAESCVPRALCFARLTGEAESRLERLTRPEAMRRLVRHCPWASYDTGTARAHLRVLGRLADQCRPYALHAGRDLVEGPGRAAELLAACFAE